MNIIILPGIFLSGALSFALGQSTPEVLGNSSAIVLDIKLIEEKEFLVATTGNEIQIWNYKSKKLMNSWRTSKTISISYFKDKLAGVSKSGDIVVWNIPNGKILLERNLSASPLTTVAWLDSMSIFAGGDNGALLKINSSTGDIISKIEHGSAITAMALGQNSMLIVGDERGVVDSYDGKAMVLNRSVKAHKSWITEIRTAVNGNFVTTSDDGYFKKWSAQSTLLQKKKIGNWVLCGDLFDEGNVRSNLIALGNSSGGLLIFTGAGTYSMKLKSLINSIAIIKGKLPIITLAVGTHGNGIQLLEAKIMKVSTH